MDVIVLSLGFCAEQNDLQKKIIIYKCNNVIKPAHISTASYPSSQQLSVLKLSALQNYGQRLQYLPTQCGPSWASW